MPAVEDSATRTPIRWPAGAWFGTQLGCTLWVLVGAVGMAPSAPWVAALVLAAFLAANVSGTWLWRRHLLGHRAAAPLMLLACGAAGLVALVGTDSVQPAAARSGVPVGIYVLVLGVPSLLALMTFFRDVAAGGHAEPGAAPDRGRVVGFWDFIASRRGPGR